MPPSNRSRCSLQGNRYIKCPDSGISDEGEFLIFTEVGKGMENAPLLGREDNQEAERGDDAAQTQGEDEESRLSRKEVIAVMSVVQKLEEELQSVKEALKAALGVMLRPPPPLTHNTIHYSNNHREQKTLLTKISHYHTHHS